MDFDRRETSEDSRLIEKLKEYPVSLKSWPSGQQRDPLSDSITGKYNEICYWQSTGSTLHHFNLFASFLVVFGCNFAFFTHWELWIFCLCAGIVASIASIELTKISRTASPASYQISEFSSRTTCNSYSAPNSLVISAIDCQVVCGPPEQRGLSWARIIENLQGHQISFWKQHWDTVLPCFAEILRV